MPEADAKQPIQSEPTKRAPTEKPLMFISHDTRDANLAEAFAKLLTNVSAGVLKSFRSSDRKGRQGIEYGVEWYPELMKQLEKASDVVCLLTPRSLDRPWILYEAGVAKGKLDTPVYGIALGVPLSTASSGPFAQFQNCDDDEESLTKLVMQLVERIPGSAPDYDAILMQVRTFKERAKGLLANLGGTEESQQDAPPDNSAIAKMFEEVKVMFRDLPGRFEGVVADGDRPLRRRRPFRFHPMMVDEIMHFGGRALDAAVGVLVLASFLREDFPWLYELGVEAFHALRSGDAKKGREALKAFQRTAEFTAKGPLMEALGPPDRESHMFLMELPGAIDRVTQRFRPPAAKETEEETQ